MSIFGKSDRGDSDSDRAHPATLADSSAPSRPATTAPPSMAPVSSTPPARGTASADMSVVSRGLTIDGNLSGEDDIRIDGTVTGDITSRTLIVSQGATVNGSINAEMIEVLGHISGELNGKTVRIAGTGQLDGDVNYEMLSIESGAIVNGAMRHKSAKGATNAAHKAGNGAAKPTDLKDDPKAADKAEAKPSAS